MNILIVDDEKSIRLSLEISLKAQGHNVHAAEDGEAALRRLDSGPYEIAILDINLPGIDGIEVLKRIRLIQPACVVIMMTYMSEVRLAVKAMKLGAFDYFTKPFALEEMNTLIRNVSQYVNVKKQLDGHEDKGTPLIGKSEAICNIRTVIDKIKRVRHHTSILISGESGTGKEIIARAIHDDDPIQPFIAINCAAIPKTLQESEFFGYEKGAFSDARDQKKGLIEKADGGVLFLDEVADMDTGLQAKLLRVLQEKKFRRLGGVDEIAFDAMIIAATNKDLTDEIEEGNFRRDLFYRLNIVQISVPPLRERKEDIPLLVMFFVNHYNKVLDRSVTRVDDIAMERLIQYDWPGNVRELKNSIERSMIFMESSVIQLEDLPREVLEQQETLGADDGLMDSVNKTVILKTLSRTNWNISKASIELGMSRLTLRRKIEKYGLKNPNKSGNN